MPSDTPAYGLWSVPQPPLNVSAVHVEAAARARGIRCEHRVLPVMMGGRRVERPWLLLDTGRRTFLYHEGAMRLGLPSGGGIAVGPHLNGPLVRTTMDKAATKRAVRAAGGMVPRGLDQGRDDIDDALRGAEALGPPLCLKPATGEKGRLVFTGVVTMEEARRRFAMIAEHFPRVLIEEEVPGANHRFLFLRPEVVAVARQDPPLLIGDGHHTLAQLLDGFNESRRRRDHPAYQAIPADPALLGWLGSLGLRLDGVPEAGRRIRMATPAAWTAEDAWVDALDAVHPSYAAVVAAVCNRLDGLLIGGIDVIIADPGAPAAPGNHWFLEINSSPDLDGHHNPWDGPSRDVAGILLDRLLRAA